MGKPKFVVLDQAQLIQHENNIMNVSQTLSAYEISTAKILKSASPDTGEYGKCQDILCASRNDWLVLCIDSELHIFDTTMGCTEYGSDKSRPKGRSIEHLSKANKQIRALPAIDEGKVVEMQFLPYSDVLVLLLNTGTLLFYSLGNQFLHKKTLLNPSIEDCSLCIAPACKDAYSACILDRQKSTMYLLTIPEFDVFQRDEEKFQEQCSSVTLKQTVNFAGNSNSKLFFAINGTDNFVFFPNKKGEAVCEIPLDADNDEELTELFTLREDVQMVRIVGNFVMALTPSGMLLFYDRDTLILCHKKMLFTEDEAVKEALDFQFLNIYDGNEIENDAKILLKIKTATGIQFAIMQFNLRELQLTANCSQHAVLIPFAASENKNNIVYVDAFPTESPDSIFVRFVNEAQPIVRLNKLLDLNRFADALQFAKTNQLELDLVYSAVVCYCQEQIREQKDGNYKEELFNELMRNLELLEDHDNAGDLCIAVLPFVSHYDHIKQILEFSKKLNITDKSTLKELAEFRYELTSYRMVYGTEDAHFGRNLEWQKFKANETRKEFFEQLCAEGKIEEARILFTRYIDIQQNLIKRAANKKLLSVFKQVVSVNPSKCSAISEFVESDLMPVFLFSEHESVKETCMDVCEFLIDTAMLFEQIEPNEFPQNALKFAQTFNRAIQLLKKDCKTTDQNVGFLHILKQLDGVDSASSIAQLNTLIRNLTKLDKIHTVYKCPLSYAEFLSENVNSICYRILDRVRTVQSIKEHIEQFVFPYIEEHRLNRNEMLHAYIKNLASAYYASSSQNANTWDILCLQITEQITDVNIRCKAIIEIASGAALPWNQQLSNVIKSILAHSEKMDPELITNLKMQCSYAELGQIFIAYNIPLEVRSRLIGNSNAIKELLRFLFANSDKSMTTKLQDAFKIVDIYESLESRRSLSNVDCYFEYAYVLIRQFKDDSEITALLEMFQLIKQQDEVEAVANKLIYHFKGLLAETKLKAIIVKRPIWIACLLGVLERFMPNNAKNQRTIDQTRNIRTLQNKHNIIVGFDTLQKKSKCLELLAKFIANTECTTVTIVAAYGNLLSLSLLETCTALIHVLIEAEMPGALLSTLDYLLSNEMTPSKQHLETAMETFSVIYWNFTQMVIKMDAHVELCKHSVHLLSKALPRLIEWAVRLEAHKFAEAFLKQSSYISLFSLILEHCTTEHDPTITSSNSNETITPMKKDGNEQTKQDCKLYTTKPRVGVMLPNQEGTMFDPCAVVKAIAIVASSVVEPPVEIDKEQFDEQMCESWQKLFILLSSSHILLEIQARQFSNSLPCFNKNTKVTTTALMGMDQHVTELCKKILIVPIADLHLAIHLLGSLTVENMNRSLQELRRWMTAKKNARCMLNLIRVSLFLLVQTSQDMAMIKQIAIWYESTKWQKRMFKHGVNLGSVQLKRENVFDLASEFAKVLLPAAVLKEYCEDVGANEASVLLNYGIELCKLSSCLPPDSKNFHICIETAKAALENLDGDERTIVILNQTIQEICPYNYEAIGILLQKLQEFITSGVLNKENCSNFAKINDFTLLIKFLSLYKRHRSILPLEIRWYKQFVNPKHYDISMLTKSGLAETFNETGATLDASVMPTAAGHHQKFSGSGGRDALQNETTNLPANAQKRLPFHIFLVEDKEAYEKYQTPFVHNEIDIYNVEHWISLVEETKVILQQSRTSLLVGAINVHVHDIVKYNRALTEDDLKQIKHLIFDSHNRLSILKGLASRFQRIPLGQSKIALIQLCCDIVEEWIRNAGKLQISEKESGSYIQSRAALVQVLAALNIENLLETNGLLDADTATLTEKPEELINHLLCNSKIDWADPDCIAKYFEIIEEITKIRDVDMEEIFNDLIDHWIMGNTEQFSRGITAAKIAAPTDPDATIDFMKSSSNTQIATIGAGGDDCADFTVPVLYDDPNTTRIVLLLSKIKDPQEKIEEFSQRLRQNVSMLAGGYLTKIRIASCLLRFLNDEQMQKHFATNHNQYCASLVTLFNQRLYSICRIEIASDELQDMEKKIDFVRTLLSPQSIYRQTPEIANLLFCLVVDNGIDDLALLGKTADRLLQLRLSRQLQELLKYIRGILNKDIVNIPNLAMYYGHTFEALFGKLDYANDHKEVRGLVHFLLGCPIEGGSHFLRAQSMLNAANAKCAAALVAIAGNAVADVSLPIKELEDGDAADSDVKLTWQ